MVRLKDYEVVIQKDGKEISIPYGAIKSKFLNLLPFIAKKFQFLMVRLKDLNIFFHIFLFFYFNSLWCD